MSYKLILEELIDINECAALLKLSISKLRKMCMKKEIPHLKLGQRVLFYKPDLSKWIMSNNINNP